MSGSVVDPERCPRSDKADAVELVSLIQTGSRFESLKPFLVDIFDIDFIDGVIDEDDLCQSVEPKFRLSMKMFARTELDCHLKMIRGHQIKIQLSN